MNLLQLLFIGNIGLIELIILVVFVLLVFMLPFRLYNRKRDKPIVKNIFGVLYLLIGLALIGLGIEALNYVATIDNSFEGQISNELNNGHRSMSNGVGIAGIASITVGLIFFICGIILIATKSNAQRIKEAEIIVQKMQTSNAPPSIDNPTVDDKIAQVEKLGELREKGLITEEEFQQQKKKILG